MPSGSRSRLQAAKLSLPCLCCLSTTLCPRSSGVWLRQAETAVLGAGGRGAVRSAIPTLSVLMSGGSSSSAIKATSLPISSNGSNHFEKRSLFVTPLVAGEPRPKCGVSCGANGDTVSCLRRMRSLFRFSSLKGSKPQRVSPSPSALPSPRHAVRVAFAAPGSETFFALLALFLDNFVPAAQVFG